MDGFGLIMPHYLCAIMNEKEDIHIGHLIQAQLKTDQRSVGWLSREIGCSRNHVYKIFNKSSLDSRLRNKSVTFAVTRLWTTVT